jgi:anti-anti-sigma factor
MGITFEEKETEIYLDISERLSFQMHPEFNDCMDLVNEKQKNLVINLENLDMIDSAGIGMLFLAQKITDTINRTLIVKNPTGQVKRIFEVTNLDSQIKIVNN